jgi:hypothetical protein
MNGYQNPVARKAAVPLRSRDIPSVQKDHGASSRFVGGYAEYALVEAGKVARKPSTFD